MSLDRLHKNESGLWRIGVGGDFVALRGTAAGNDIPICDNDSRWEIMAVNRAFGRSAKVRSKTASGFTLIELLVALAVLVIVTTVAIPSFTELVRNNRQVAQANELLTAFIYARSEAVRLRVPVRVCASSSGDACLATSTWEQGWLVYADENDDSVIDDGEILRVWPKLDGADITLRPEPDAAVISYDANGVIDDKRSFVLCDGRGATAAKAVNILSVGRARMASHTGASGSNDSAIVDDVNGSDIAC
ncbi:MAG: GspH/FimT family pseudopilin [Aquisalimonadaceae bacterium]